MKRYRRGTFFFLCYILAVLTFSFSEAYASSSHFQKGKDWMDLQKYDDARYEFELAIQEEPKNVDARYYIAQTYYLQGRLRPSLNWCREALSVNQNHQQTLQQ